MGTLTANRNEGGIDLSSLLNNLPVAIYTCDRDGYVDFFNEAAIGLWGGVPEKGKDLWNRSWKLYYPDGRQMPVGDCPLALTLKKGLQCEGAEITIERPDRSFRNLLIFSSPIFNDKNFVIGSNNTLVDITGLKKGEEKQEILSAIVESSDDAIVSKTLDGIITSWNRGAQKIFEYTEAEIVGKHINILIPSQLQKEEQIIIKNIKAGNKIDHFRTVRLTKSGNEVNVSITVSPVKNTNGVIVGASKIARDISEQLHREEMIRQAAQRLEILNSIGRTISEKLDVRSILQRVTDATTTITGAAFGAFYYNAVDENGEEFMLFTLSGASKEAFKKAGMPGNTAVFHPVFAGQGVVRVDDITRDERYSSNDPYFGMLKGNLSVVSYMAVPVISRSGKVLGGLFFGHPSQGIFKPEHEDILVSIASQASVALDNSKLFEEVIALNSKKDEFIALASHELKTPLTTAKGYLQILQEKNEKEQKDPVSRIFIGKSLKQVDRLNSLIADLFDISKIEAGRLELSYEFFDLNELLTDVIETFRYSTSTHELVYENSNEFFVEADKQRMEQVVINLLTNAIKYSPHSNRVVIELSDEGEYAVVKIKDEGIGLTKEQQGKIFTRFYRVSGNSNISGLGLGLYITKEIIDHHHGNISLISEPGKGSTFIFSIPSKNKTLK